MISYFSPARRRARWVGVKKTMLERTRLLKRLANAATVVLLLAMETILGKMNEIVAREGIMLSSEHPLGTRKDSHSQLLLA